MQKCVWCNRSDGKLKAIHVQMLDALTSEPTELEVAVHLVHERKARAYHAERREHVHTWFSIVVGITAALAAIVVVGTPLIAVFESASRVVPSLLLIACGAALLGISGTMIMYPFPTPQTVSLFSIRRSKQIT